MRLVFSSLSVLLIVLTALNPAYAQVMSEKKQNEVCLKSPLNTQCQGDKIALDDRPGEAGACTIIVNKIENQTVCKLVVTNQGVTAYYELGTELQSLKDRKATREIQISPQLIKQVGYQESEKDNSTARVVNTVLFGLGGLFGTRNKKVAIITLDYVLPLQSSTDPQQTEPTTEKLEPPTSIKPQTEETSHTLKIMVRRKTGEDLRQKLEQLTGKSSV